MNKSRVETWVWVLVYGGLLMVSVAVFVLRAADAADVNVMGWLMLATGALAAAAGAALVVVRARMEEPLPPKKGQRQ